MGRSLDRALSLLMTIAALTVAVVFVLRQTTGSRTTPASAMEVERLPEWEQLRTGGRRVGSLDAPLHVVEFGDFQCPYCARLHGIVESFIDEFGDDVAFTYYHLPLPMHRFAREAAGAAECASVQGAFRGFARELFAHQDSIGHREWRSFAVAAGVPDTAQFDTCMRETWRFAGADSGAALAERLSISATPTVIVNGWRLPRPPTRDSLERFLSDARRGREIFQERSNEP